MKNDQSKIILIDQDGVLADYTKAHLEAIREAFPELERISPLECIKWNTEEHFPPRYRKRIEALALSPGFFRNLEPLPGAILAMKELLQDGHDVRICTAPKRAFENCVGEKFAWVKEHLGQEFAERIIMTRDKTLVQGDILIDDKPDVSGRIVPSWTHILFDQPYNRSSRVRRINWQNYREVLEL